MVLVVVLVAVMVVVVVVVVVVILAAAVVILVVIVVVVVVIIVVAMSFLETISPLSDTAYPVTFPHFIPLFETHSKGTQRHIFLTLSRITRITRDSFEHDSSFIHYYLNDTFRPNGSKRVVEVIMNKPTVVFYDSSVILVHIFLCSFIIPCLYKMRFY